MRCIGAIQAIEVGRLLDQNLKEEEQLDLEEGGVVEVAQDGGAQAGPPLRRADGLGAALRAGDGVEVLVEQAGGELGARVGEVPGAGAGEDHVVGAGEDGDDAGAHEEAGGAAVGLEADRALALEGGGGVVELGAVEAGEAGAVASDGGLVLAADPALGDLDGVGEAFLEVEEGDDARGALGPDPLGEGSQAEVPCDVMFTGPAGAGKTTLLLMAAAHWNAQGRSVRCARMRDFKRALEGMSGAEEAEALDAYLLPQVLLLDDLGSRQSNDETRVVSGHEVDILLTLHNRRSNAGRATWFTTNLTVPQLRMLYGDPLISRITDQRSVLVVDFTGQPNRRWANGGT